MEATQSQQAKSVGNAFVIKRPVTGMMTERQQTNEGEQISFMGSSTNRRHYNPPAAGINGNIASYKIIK